MHSKSKEGAVIVRGVEVVLVGRERPGDENLGIRYLAAALRKGGHVPRIVPLCHIAEIDDAVREVLAVSPRLVGISISDGHVAMDMLPFARQLRAKGYAGHIVAGGPLATLCRSLILATQPAIDSVVRHDGEAVLVELASRLARGESLDGMAGLTTRAGDGAPARVTDRPWQGVWPERAETLPRILGVPVARLLGSRGCLGSCPYCGSSAIRAEARSEGARLGLSVSELDRAEVGRRRGRDVEDLAAEVADLYHQKGARFFHLVDDNVLTGDEHSAIAWLRSLRASLNRRRVGRTAWSVMVEPSAATPAAIEAMRELGVVRALVGVEALTSRGLSALGRQGEAGAGARAAKLLRDRGIATLFNSILVHPDVNSELLEAELGALEPLDGIHIDALTMMLLPGTAMFARLEREGRVTGGLFGYDFSVADPSVSRFREILMLLALHEHDWYSTGLFAHEVATNVAVARQLGLPSYDADSARELAELSGAVNDARIGAWRKALALAHADLPDAERALATTALVAELRCVLLKHRRTIDAIQTELEGRARVTGQARTFLLRSAMAASIAIVAAGCGGKVETSELAAAGAGGMGGQRGGTGGQGGRAGSADASVGTGGSWIIAAGGYSASGGDEASGGAGGADTVYAGNRDMMCTSLVDAGAPDAGCNAGVQQQCFSVQDLYKKCSSLQAGGCTWILLDETGKAVDILSDMPMILTPELRRCVLETFAAVRFPCLAGQPVTVMCLDELR